MTKPEPLPREQPDEALQKLPSDLSSNYNVPLKVSEKDVYEAIQACNVIGELSALYKQFPQFQESLRVDFEARKSLITNLSNPNNFSQNGKSRIQ